MSVFDWAQLVVFVGALIGLIPLLGGYMAKVFEGQCTPVHTALGWLENACYSIGGIDSKLEMPWKSYLKALLIFNFIGFIAIFILQLSQGYLPLNPQSFGAPTWDSVFNTSASFTTNTNWQSYAGETTLSYLTQMLGMTVQNFLSAATGVCVLLALIRGIVRKDTRTIGNFWTDLVRTLVYILLPLSLILAIILTAEGVVQSFSPYVEVTTLENAKQTIPLGPVASQVAIKQLGTNGGGFFNANSAHPFENPTGLTNFLEALSLILIPAALVYTFGILANARKHALVLLSTMFLLWLGGLGISLWSESVQNPVLEAYPVWEGKETRFGVMNSVLWAVNTTGSSNGAVNSIPHP